MWPTIYLLGAGALLSFAGSLPPGLISLSVARMAVLRGFGPAFVLALGAAMAEFFQAGLAAACARWLTAHPMVEVLLRRAAGPVFGLIAVYLWFWAKPPHPSAVVVGRPGLWVFSQGVLVSAFNLLAVPYWVAYTGWLRSNGWWQERWKGYALFAFGVVLGTLGALALYARLGGLLHRQGYRAHRAVNRAVAVLFAGLGIWAFAQGMGR
jgi:threonine/homoserine/homoserine lactone efflux protein